MIVVPQDCPLLSVWLFMAPPQDPKTEISPLGSQTKETHKLFCGDGARAYPAWKHTKARADASVTSKSQAANTSPTLLRINPTSMALVTVHRIPAKVEIIWRACEEKNKQERECFTAFARRVYYAHGVVGTPFTETFSRFEETQKRARGRRPLPSPRHTQALLPAVWLCFYLSTKQTNKKSRPDWQATRATECKGENYITNQLLLSSPHHDVHVLGEVGGPFSPPHEVDADDEGHKLQRSHQAQDEEVQKGQRYPRIILWHHCSAAICSV